MTPGPAVLGVMGAGTRAHWTLVRSTGGPIAARRGIVARPGDAASRAVHSARLSSFTVAPDNDLEAPGDRFRGIRGGGGDRVTAPAMSGRGPGEGGGPVAVTHESQAAGQWSGFGQGRRRISRGPDGQV